MKMESGHIIAEVTLTGDAAAGNFGTEPISSYPTILSVGSNAFSSQALLQDRSSLKPGIVLKIAFKFLFPEPALSKLEVGTEFSIWERTHVGKGVVVEKVGLT